MQTTIQVNGWPVHYEVAGAGEPLVLVHGLSESTRLWSRNVPELAGHYRVYLVDLPGFGTMRRYRQHFDLTRSGLWLAAWLEALGLQTVNLVGHSMGGYVSMALAATHPERVKRLVLVDSIGMPLNLPVRRLIYQALKAIARTLPAFWMCIGYDYLRAGPRTILRATQQIVTLEAADVLATLAGERVPTLVIWGERDDLVPFSLGRQLHARLNGARLCVLPGANHFCMFEQPRAFNRALLAFLQGEETHSSEL
jgi:pimeloyl-ACP methyl ester carboxylesterase